MPPVPPAPMVPMVPMVPGDAGDAADAGSGDARCCRRLPDSRACPILPDLPMLADMPRSGRTCRCSRAMNGPDDPRRDRCGARGVADREERARCRRAHGRRSACAFGDEQRSREDEARQRADEERQRAEEEKQREAERRQRIDENYQRGQESSSAAPGRAPRIRSRASSTRRTRPASTPRSTGRPTRSTS